MGTEAFAMASNADQLPNRVPWHRSFGPVRRTANSEALKCRLAPSHHGEAGVALPSSAGALFSPADQRVALRGEDAVECPRNCVVRVIVTN